MNKLCSHLGRDAIQEIHILPAGVILRIEVNSARWLIERQIDHHFIVIYEESRNTAGRWIGVPNPLAVRPPLSENLREVPANSRLWKSTGKCDFCNKPMPPSEQLAEDGWIPSYWSPPDNEEILEPVCGECVKKYLDYDEENCDYSTKPRGVPDTLQPTIQTTPTKPMTLLGHISKMFWG